MKKILPKTFAESAMLTNAQIEDLVSGTFYFEAEDENFIEVTAWMQYPSYDLIYGRPTPDSKRFDRETAAMCVRYANGRTYCTFLDNQELRDTIEALTEIWIKRPVRANGDVWVPKPLL